MGTMSKPRMYHGVQLIKVEDGRYKTPDGEYEIYRDDEFETECMEAHPCRMGKKMRAEMTERYQAEISRGATGSRHQWAERALRSVYGADAFECWRDGRRGWYCYGGEPHFYAQWVAWAGEFGWSGEWTDTFKDACEDLRDHLAKQAA